MMLLALLAIFDFGSTRAHMSLSSTLAFIIFILCICPDIHLFFGSILPCTSYHLWPLLFTFSHGKHTNEQNNCHQYDRVHFVLLNCESSSPRNIFSQTSHTPSEQINKDHLIEIFDVRILFLLCLVTHWPCWLLIWKTLFILTNWPCSVNLLISFLFSFDIYWNVMLWNMLN